MIEVLEFIDELKELQALYHSGDLRDFDFSTKIQKYERQVSQFEEAIEEQHKAFFNDVRPFYDSRREV